MNESIFLLDKRVVFDSTKMTLSHGNEIIRISEAETHLLLAFRHGLYKKEDIIHFVWENRGGCVSESSYYKLINQMRNDFSRIGLQPSDIVTRPRVGVSLSVAIEPIKKITSVKVSDENVNDTLTRDKIFYKIKRHSVFVVLTGVIILVLLYGIFNTPVRNSPDSFFTYLGEYNNYVIYKTKEDKVTLSEVVFAYNSLKIKIYRQNGRHLYYIREPNMNIFLQCLNPVEMAVPKCITVKERY
ncbi:hypothetical protein LAN87_003026 [Salmonella enterica]|nr:hypothetical protein [Salmonella enterica]HCM1832457.1 hypothetical protein [Salmonella enterica subsp. salamae serovar 48:z81:z39]EHX3572940.1 hypothetical protein [Salmonella enterica]EIB6274977.1 hypothetical protein [Salmonella enterica]EIC8062216.1 hypothetical protein [Salmonella enterica]